MPKRIENGQQAMIHGIMRWALITPGCPAEKVSRMHLVVVYENVAPFLRRRITGAVVFVCIKCEFLTQPLKVGATYQAFSRSRSTIEAWQGYLKQYHRAND